MDYDVIVVGGGNAAFAASVSAREHGAKRVLLLEKAPHARYGGNTHFSGAILRFAYNDVFELDRFVPDAERDYPGFHAQPGNGRRAVPLQLSPRHRAHVGRCLPPHRRTLCDAGQGVTPCAS